ncbi:MAG TPA: hypothetical protein VK718_02750 [Ferruginibacter sp.]|nr:hypothetical protein [Ferruginibacter sp.]
MRLTIAVILISTLAFSCKNGKNIPDVSNIKIDITTERFDKDLFAIDSNNFAEGYQKLETKDPFFSNFFIGRTLNLDPTWPRDTVLGYVAQFTSAYRPVYDSAALVFNDFSTYENDIKQASQFLKYYFPAYPIPSKIITYIGPLDGDGDLLATGEAFLVGLQVHMGRNYSMYKTSFVSETYPGYVTYGFEPSYIVVNYVKDAMNDLYPEKEDDRPMIDQMIDKGKRLYVLSKLLPYTEEYKLIGYTEKQLKDCYDHEAVVWSMFIQNGTLQATDKDVIKTYLGPSPKTVELGEDAPGNIGSFAGWQIIKKYMSNNPTKTLPQLMATDAEVIFQETKYKP